MSTNLTEEVQSRALSVVGSMLASDDDAFERYRELVDALPSCTIGEDGSISLDAILLPMIELIGVAVKKCAGQLATSPEAVIFDLRAAIPV